MKLQMVGLTLMGVGIASTVFTVPAGLELLSVALFFFGLAIQYLAGFLLVGRLLWPWVRRLPARALDFARHVRWAFDIDVGPAAKADHDASDPPSRPPAAPSA
ncbi:hypothetical protein DDF62_04650 [Caulobacter radicis]|uniref:hypothetical protein n=1 Tax=Caulobacter radicis TaxID=2172650 RepID=UPI000D57C4A5|nr:hypothetical protein [Caulobacter radicis]PVM92436.1 hypothetical protein DDF62_04650 [Caulobacter radicis]